MDKKKIEKQYNIKIKEFVRLNKFYYQYSKPAAKDEEFDKLKEEILILEKQYKFLKSKNSPSKIVGYKPAKTFKKALHKVPMLSLANAFSEEDLNNFEKRIINYLDKVENFKIEYSAEPKIDGISASLIYKKGKFITGLSRGDGKEGEDITENLKTIEDIPNYIVSKDFPEEIDIRGEVFIQNSDFKKISEKFANPRNAASGTLRQKNPEETKKIPLKFIAYTFGYEKGLKLFSQNEYLKKLKEWGFKTNPLNKTFQNVKDLMQNYHDIEKK
jgi:DNA ligase (NAD+)